MRCLATVIVTLMLAFPDMAVELFRYRGASKDGGTLEYVFQTSEQDAGRRTGDTGKGPMHQKYFVVVLPNGAVFEPGVAKRL